MYDLGRFREAETQLVFVLHMVQATDKAREVLIVSFVRLDKIREMVGISAEAIELMVQIAQGESEDSSPSSNAVAEHSFLDEAFQVRWCGENDGVRFSCPAGVPPI